MIYAIYRQGDMDPPVIRAFASVEEARAFVASRPGEVWEIANEEGGRDF
jgi:hypothetical protein